jgi:hypothetical protein
MVWMLPKTNTLPTSHPHNHLPLRRKGPIGAEGYPYNPPQSTQLCHTRLRERTSPLYIHHRNNAGAVLLLSTPRIGPLLFHIASSSVVFFTTSVIGLLAYSLTLVYFFF